MKVKVINIKWNADSKEDIKHLDTTIQLDVPCSLLSGNSLSTVQ
jgi:hypothetical protein